jgi:hypothetical protein
MENENKTIDYADSVDERDETDNSVDDIDLDDNIEKKDEDESIEEKTKKDDSVIIAKSKLVLIKKLLANIKENSDKLSDVLSGFISEEDEAMIKISQSADDDFKSGEETAGDGKIIEGVFDGENMIGPDGKEYSVPANYASKSKMVEGDILKLTITAKGTFIYKQISPIERARIIGRLEKEGDGDFYVYTDSRKWRVLTASVTYFKGEPGDEAVILTPKSGESKWAAVENIIRNRNSEV